MRKVIILITGALLLFSFLFPGCQTRDASALPYAVAKKIAIDTFNSHNPQTKFKAFRSKRDDLKYAWLFSIVKPTGDCVIVVYDDKHIFYADLF